MANDLWIGLQVTHRCEPAPPDGTLYLPKGTAPIPRMVVRPEGGNKVKLVEGGVKSDNGPGACATGALLAFLGGTNARIEYREATFGDKIMYGESVLRQLTVTLLTFVSSIIAAIATYLTSSSDPTKAFVYGMATTVVTISFVLALLKLLDDFRKL